MNPLLADVIGLVGSALFLGAFAYANVAKRLNKVAFNLANLVGAILLLISLSVTFNLAAFVLELAWGLIALVGLTMAIHKSPSRKREGRRMIIAVDGPTASGKGTIARALAAHYGLPHLDTGLLYRAVGRQVFLDGGDPDDSGDALAATGFSDGLLADPELRTEATGGYASRVSVHPAVRQALYERQRVFATQPGGAVLDGRDIGTVIAPDAEVKLFVTATVDARAERRWNEMRETGRDATLEAIAADIRRRDARDANRAEAPLRVAEGAFVIDNSELTKEQALAAAIKAVETALWV